MYEYFIYNIVLRVAKLACLTESTAGATTTTSSSSSLCCSRLCVYNNHKKEIDSRIVYVRRLRLNDENEKKHKVSRIEVTTTGQETKLKSQINECIVRLCTQSKAVKP